jgi:hypothetical protein
MIPGQTSFAGNLIQVDGFLIAFVDKRARATEPLVNLAADLRFGVSHL